jgi:hypothetical protein
MTKFPVDGVNQMVNTACNIKHLEILKHLPFILWINEEHQTEIF